MYLNHFQYRRPYNVEIGKTAQSAGAIEYTDYIFAEGKDSLNVTQSAGAVEYTDGISTDR